MGCDKLKVYVPQDGPYGLEPEEGGETVEEETCYLKSDADAVMAELKAFNCVDSDVQEFCEPRLMYLKSEADKVIAELEENHKNEVERLLMKIAGLEKLVETADKLLKPKGGFTIEDVTFKGVKLEGFEKEAK